MSNQTIHPDHAEILAGFEQDLADAIEQTGEAEMTLRRCREREAECRRTVEERREVVLASVAQEVVRG